jgi:peptide/nickel transport system substrate-binding protein
VGEIYEPLFWENSYTGRYVPKLAVAYHYNAAHTAIIFSLRRNVRWSDGQPFTAQDVAYTFNLILSHPALDINGISAIVRSVSVDNPYEVTVNLKAPQSADFYEIACNTPIVPMHIWEHIKNPVTYTDPHPVTTGPFLVGSFSPSVFTLLWRLPAKSGLDRGGRGRSRLFL